MRRTILRIAAGILIAGLTLIAGSQLPGIGSIEGTIVRLGTGEPISGVNVEMLRVEGTAASPLGPLVFPGGNSSPGAVVTANAPNPSDIFYARTGSDGRFVFRNLKPGKYRLLAAHPAGLFYAAEYGQRSPRGPGYNFSLEELQSKRIRMEMAPMASVTGRIIGADGKPAPHVQVIAAEIAYQNGARVFKQVQSVQTDDRGNYRLFWLPPGRYVVAANYEGLRRRYATVAFGPPGAVESLRQIFPQALLHYTTDGSGQAVEETYETVYSPGETNPESARVLDLRLGSALAGIDISLAAGRRRALKIRGVVIDSQTGQPVPNATLRAWPRRGGPTVTAPISAADANGVFEITGLREGSSYSIAARGPVNQTAVSSLDVGATDIEGLRLVLTPGIALSGRIAIDGQATDEYRVSLARDNQALPTPIGSPVAQGSFAVSGVYPGEYRVSVTPVSSSAIQATYIKSIRWGGAEVPNGDIRVSDGSPLDLDVMLGRNGGTLEGHVQDTQVPAANVLVVLIPTTSRRADLFMTATTDTAGRFRIQGIAPGNYLVFAYPWLPAGSWLHPEFLNTVRSRGRGITLSEGSNANLELALLPEVTF